MIERVQVAADGGSRGNPGTAGYGAVVKDSQTGELLVECAGGLGVATNNVAEYSALIAGLKAARALGASIVDVQMDSRLIIEQMSGRWKIKNNELRSLAAQAQELAAHFERVHYEWIPRARNAHADRLANTAMDRQTLPTRLNSGKATLEEAEPVAPQDAAKIDHAAGWSGSQGIRTRFLLLRHGQTALSAERRYSGRDDVPLTEVGLSQAVSLAARLARSADLGKPPIVSSPLARATQTAQVVADALGSRFETDSGLLEADFGHWEGLTFEEASRRDPELHARWLCDSSRPAPAGESFDQVFQRVRVARDEIVAKYSGQTVLLVSHVTPIKSLLRMGLDVGPSLYYRLHLDLASLSIVDFYPGDNATVRVINDTSHLP